MNKIRTYIIRLFLLLSIICWNKTYAADEASLLIRSQKALTKVITHDIFSPPVASRIYLYASIAAYETSIIGQHTFMSLHHSIPSFPDLNISPSGKVDMNVAVIQAFFHAANQFVFSEQMLKDSLSSIMLSFKKLDASVLKRSIELGNRVADSILKWSEGDNYRNTRKLRRYTLSKGNKNWIPTPPGYLSAVEPHWAKMRTVAMDSASEFRPEPAIEFNTDKNSEFFREAYYVYKALDSSSAEKKAIANFWDCNPFFISTKGHLNYAIKKMSPGGHWMFIAGIAAGKTKLDLTATAAAYCITAIALYDGFISCWEEKFRSNVIRPETYINAYIDETWRPFLQTPPFPEYSSGHSVISNAAAVVLTSFFGNNFIFTDSSEVEYGAGVRKFTSFLQAADEASISRIYGGIHYLPAITGGQRQGKNIGQKILDKIKLKDE